jgi:hypothetical protein
MSEYHQKWKQYLNEAVYGLSSYHGTEFENLQSILQTGLVAKSPKGVNQKGVYITPDIELAARYGLNWGLNLYERVKISTPIVFELYISKPKRTKRLQYDPLDRQENAWSTDSYGETPESEVLAHLESDIWKVISDLGLSKRYDFQHVILQAHDYDLESYDGLNLTRDLAKDIMRFYQLPAQRYKEVVAATVNVFQSGTDYEGLMEITDDGTLKLQSDYYESREQLIYPENLPISTVKYLWVRVEDFNLPWQAYEDTRVFGFKMLPQEARGLLDNIERALRDLAYSELDAIYDQELISAISLLEGEGYDDIVNYLQKLLDMTDEQRFEMDRDAHQEMLLDASGWIHNDWFQDNVIADKTRWGKLTIGKAPLLLSNRINKDAE